jgi:hypothetical protein
MQTNLHEHVFHDHLWIAQYPLPLTSDESTKAICSTGLP